jgi:hypothetical protein
MRSLRIFLMVLVSFASLPALARQAVPIVNFENVAVTTPSGRAPTLEQVKQAVFSAAAARSWTLQEQGPGRVLATLHVRGKHTASVLIVYSAQAFSITYVDSVNLNYRMGPDGQPAIHPHYNDWVQNLTQGISASLAKT